MSAHSFPSLTSDSSSFPSRSSDLHDPHNNDQVQSTVSSISRTSQAPSLNPEVNSEILLLRNKVSKLEQDKFVLGDYAAELQSRIRQLERERMGCHVAIKDCTDLDPKTDKAQSKLSTLVRSLSFAQPSSPVALPIHEPRASSSLSAATSTAVKRALTRAVSSPQSRSLNASQLAFPAPTSTPTLVSKHLSRPVPPEAIDSFRLELPNSSPHNNTLQDSPTPTRKRLQAMYGRLSLDPMSFSSSVNGPGPSNHGVNEHDMCSDVYSTTFHRSIPSQSCHRDQDREAKRTALTSKLDSIIFTSKLFPLSSSHSKGTLESADHCSQNGHTIPLAHSAPSFQSYTGNISLNSPPRKHVKVKVPGKGNKPLSQSLGLEENVNLDVQPRSDERKSNVRSSNRVSFSGRLVSSPSDEKEDIEPDTELRGRLWGSWSRKKHSPPTSSFNTDKRTDIPRASPPSAFSARFGNSREEDRDEFEEKRGTRRRSLAAGCLRFVSGSGERDTLHPSEQRKTRVLRRSHSESRKSRSHSRSHSPLQNASRSGYPGNAGTRDKNEKERITPSRVGSPMPKGRVPDPRHGGEEPERTNSLRSAGRWGQRGRGFTHEFTRRRTIHPMFSFERPGSAGASTSSSRRADDERTVDEHHALGQDAMPQLTRVEKPLRRPRREIHAAEAGVSSLRDVLSNQEDSVTSGHTAFTVARSESVSTQKSKGPMMRTRTGVQTHGTFAFEPAAAVMVPPPSARQNESFGRDGEHSNRTRRHTTYRHEKVWSEPVQSRGERHAEDTHTQVYRKFCEDLKAVLGNGEEWSSFKKYIRRFDIKVLTAEVLLQRVKGLIEESPFTDQDTKLKLYDRFVSIVHDNLEKHAKLSS